MKGAREYAELFKTGQYGKLYITSSRHARGKTFSIQVLPEGEKAKENGDWDLCLNKNAVTVYGAIGGNCGWSEYYGWIHKGRWTQDFENLVKIKKTKLEAENKNRKEQEKKKEEVNKERVNILLSNY